MSRPVRIREAVLSLIAYAILVAALFHDVTVGGMTMASAPHIPFTLPEGPVGFERSKRAPYVDAEGPGMTHETSIPLRRHAFASGRFPLWHPHEGCGQPYLAGYLPGLLYPLHFLMLIDPPLGFDLVYLGRLLLAGWLMYLFLRVQRLRIPSAFVGGALFLGCGYLVTGANLSNASVEGLVPGLLLGVELLVTRCRRRDFVLTVAVVFAMLVGGNPEAAFVGFLLAGAYALVRTLALGRRDWIRIFGVLAAACASAALLAAPQLLPFLEFLDRADHYHHPATELIKAPTVILALFVAPGFLNDVHYPHPLSQPPIAYGIGVLGTVLMLASMADRDRRFLKYFFWIAFLFVWMVYFGVPGFQQLKWLPLVNQMSQIKYPLLPVCLAAAVLAALGFDRLLCGPPRASARWLAASSVLVGAVPAIFVPLWDNAVREFAWSRLPLSGTDPQAPCFGYLPYALAVVLGLCLLLIRIKRPAWRSRAILAFGAIILVEIHLNVPRFHAPRKSLYEPPEVLAALDKPRNDYRIYAPDLVLFRNSATIFGLNDVRYIEVLKIARYVNLVRNGFAFPSASISFSSYDHRPGAPVHTLSILGVRYVLARGPLLPLLDVPLAAHTRANFRIDLRGGGGTLEGELILAPGARGHVEVSERLLNPFAVSRILRFASGAPTSEAVLELPAGPEDALHSLGVGFTTFSALHVESLAWSDRRIPLDDLRAAAHAFHEDRRQFPLMPVRVRSDGLTIDTPIYLALPRESAGAPTRLTLRAKALGQGPVSVGLLAYRSRPIAREPMVNASMHQEATVPLEVDLARLAGKHAVVAVEIRGEARLTELRFRPEGLTHIQTRGGVDVYRNERALPRAYGVHAVEVIPEDEAQLARLLDRTFPCREAVILPAAPAGIHLPESPPGAAPVVRWIEEDPAGMRLEFEVEFAADGLLVLLDNHYPGWKAWVDARPVDVLRANYTFRAVPVPSGTHRVRFAFEPKSWTIGWWAALVGLLATCAFLVAFFPSGARERDAASGSRGVEP